MNIIPHYQMLCRYRAADTGGFFVTPVDTDLMNTAIISRCNKLTVEESLEICLGDRADRLIHEAQ